MWIGNKKQARKEIMPTSWESSRVFAELRMEIALGLIEDYIIFFASYGDFIVRKIINKQNNEVTFEIKKIIWKDNPLRAKPQKTVFWDDIGGSIKNDCGATETT